MGIKQRLDRLEKAAEQYCDELVLPDGTVVQLAPGERFDAFLAALDGEEHWLLAIVSEQDTSNGLSQGFSGLLLTIVGGGRDEPYSGLH
jgi:hypothetical protein